MKLTLNGVEIDATEEHAKLLLKNGWAVCSEEQEEKPKKAVTRKRAAKPKE